MDPSRMSVFVSGSWSVRVFNNLIITYTIHDKEFIMRRTDTVNDLKFQVTNSQGGVTADNCVSELRIYDKGASGCGASGCGCEDNHIDGQKRLGDIMMDGQHLYFRMANKPAMWFLAFGIPAIFFFVFFFVLVPVMSAGHSSSHSSSSLRSRHDFHSQHNW